MKIHDNVTSGRVNRLGAEKSAYLRQHAANPVDWFPWGEEAFAKAKSEDKPIFLSIGYSACHWCHVMERESFESDAIAGMLNRHFVSIKVDREELPGVDDVYMTAVQMMTGSGGWPLSVFLTPEREPFYGGTYFPPEDRYGHPGFSRVLQRISELWSEHRDELAQSARALSDGIRQALEEAGSSAPGDLRPVLIEQAVKALERSFDGTWGGFGPAPKFPPVPALSLLLEHYRRTGSAATLRMATLTLDRMAGGGMFDQVGGGFHRYAVDERWLVPHFEKMLYDNALLAGVYLEALALTGEARFARTASATLDYVLRDLRSAEGTFFASEDADSEGHEGLFYLWTLPELRDVLGSADAEAFAAHYGATDDGNFEGRNILHRAPDAEARAQDDRFGGMRARLLDARSRRVRPGRDEKVVVGWNAMMISALARGFQVLGEASYRDAGVKAAEWLLDAAGKPGGLRHSYADGPGPHAAYLDDYALLAAACLDLYEATFDACWIDQAHHLAREMIARFHDPGSGLFFNTGADHTHLLARSRPLMDSATPPGNAVAAGLLVRLGTLLAEPDLVAAGERVVRGVAEGLREHPRAYLSLLGVAQRLIFGGTEIVVLGSSNDARTRELLRAAWRQGGAGRTVVCADPQVGVPRLQLTEGKSQVGGTPTAYVCRGATCGPPVTDPQELARQCRE